MKNSTIFKKVIALMFLGCLLGPGCGGGGSSDEVSIVPGYPDALVAHKDHLKAFATITDMEGGAFVSNIAGTFDGELWRFSLEGAGTMPEDGMNLSVDFVDNVEVSLGGGLKVAIFQTVIPPTGDLEKIETNAASWNLAIDEDSDGLANIGELFASTNPFNPDTDGDGISDSLDALPLIAAEPEIVEAPKETVTETQPAIVVLDSDNDGLSDESDNCPNASNAYQEDADKDGLGNACDDDGDGDGVPNARDNCVLVENPRQSQDDADDDGTPSICDLDDTDAQIGEETDGIFVAAGHGSDLAAGGRIAPLKSIAAAINRAGQTGSQIFMAAGTYNVTNLVLPAGTRLSGGFINGEDKSERFLGRNYRTSDSEYLTVLTRSDLPTTITVADGIVEIDGFQIENEAASFDDTEPSAAIDVAGGTVSIARCKILGNAESERSVGIRSRGGSLSLSKNWIDGKGKSAPGSLSTGLAISSGSAKATNNVIVAGNGRFATGLEARDSDPIVVNNTIDAKSANTNMGLSIALSLSNSSPILANNLIITGNAPDQYGIICEGTAPGEGAIISNNLIARFPADVTAPVIRDCDGAGYTNANFMMGDASVANNLVPSPANRSDLVDASYNLAGPGVDSGLDAAGERFGGVTLDYLGSQRPKGTGYDIGAIEK